MNPVHLASLNVATLFHRFVPTLPSLKLPITATSEARDGQSGGKAIVLNGFWHGISMLFLYFFILPVMVADAIAFLLS